MEILNIIESALGRFAEQGYMFWSATGAVALGITLILTAGIVQLRRFHSRSVLPIIPDLDQKTEPIETPVEVDLALEMKPETQQKEAIGLNSTSEKVNAEELHPLLARLRKAADQLEDYSRSQVEMLPQSTESPLKETREGVDYLFRTGTG